MVIVGYSNVWYGLYATHVQLHQIACEGRRLSTVALSFVLAPELDVAGRERLGVE